MAVHEVNGHAQCFFCHHRIGIEQQHIVTLALPDADVVGLGKAQIMDILDDGEAAVMAKAMTQVTAGVVVRMVVDHHHLSVDARCAAQSAEHTIDTLGDIVLHIVVDDDDRQFHAFFSSGFWG